MIDCAHSGGLYSFDRGTGSFLRDGAVDIKAAGCRGIKLFMSADYDNRYNTALDGGVTTLKTLAQKTEWAALFADVDFDRYYLNCWPFVNNPRITVPEIDIQSAQWKSGVTTNYLSDEYDEIKDLAEHLLTAYAGTGKQFILQTWEGDNDLLGAFPTTRREIDRAWIINMQAWLRSRQQAVEVARRNIGQNNVSVLNAVEVNRVIDCVNDPSIDRVCTKVLPFVNADLISWSAYDGVLDLQGGPVWGASASAMLTDMSTRFADAKAVLANAAPNSGIFIGEWGAFENEQPGGYVTADIIDQVETSRNALGFIHNIYWQVWDNNIASGGDDPPDGNEDLRGNWLTRFDDTTSEAGARIAALNA